MASFKDDLYVIYNARAPVNEGPPPGTLVGPMSLPISYRKNRLPLNEINFEYFRSILINVNENAFEDIDA